MPSRTKEIAEAKSLFQGLTKAILIQAGRVIAQARRAQGLTQKELAKLAGYRARVLRTLRLGASPLHRRRWPDGTTAMWTNYSMFSKRERRKGADAHNTAITAQGGRKGKSRERALSGLAGEHCARYTCAL
jgi:hypothetical protein